MAILKLSTSYNRAFLMVESADHITPLTGATVTVDLSKNGGSFGAAGGSVTEIADGWYYVALTTTDTGTLGDLAFHCTATSGDPTDFVDQVCANILGDTLPANVTQVSGSNVSTSTAQLGVNVVKYNNQTAQTDANNLPKVDVEDIAGNAVSASSAQLGVNVVNIAGQAAALDGNNLLKVDVEDINGNATAAQNVSKANQAIGRGTCTSGGSTTSIPTSAWAPGSSGIAGDQFVGRTVIFDANTTTQSLQGQATNITANTSGANPTFTVTALTTAPSSGDTFGVY